ncbi:MAG: OB-fold nucleic acid binding domain-containing protein [Bacteroidota bacterium]
MYRTHTCGELRLEHAGEKVTICGWAHKLRDLGHFHFIDIRDRYGITQVNVKNANVELYALSQKIGREYVVQRS